MPYEADRARRRATTVTAERDERDDVLHARRGVEHTEVTYQHARGSRRPIGHSWSDFVARYGWRAYALPLLVVLTVVALATTTTTVGRRTPVARPVAPSVAPQSPTAPPTAVGSIALKNDSGGGNQTPLKAAQLPPGAAYTAHGQGTFTVLKGTSAKVGSGPLHRYSIEVEKGITGINVKTFEQLVMATLADKRSWSGHGVALQRVDSGPIDFRISLTSAMTVRKLCGYTIQVETSCYAAAGTTTPVNRVVLNVARWVRGSAAYVGNPEMYRVYMINHEDGHALGHQHAHQCLPDGLAPAMMQQTFGLRSATTDKLCQANPWPYPPGASGAPGAEQPDTAANDEYGLGD